MFALFGPTLTLRAHVLPTDELIFGDKAADASGQTAVRVLASNIMAKNAAGNYRAGTIGDLNFTARVGIQSAGNQTVLELFDGGAANTCQIALSNAGWVAGIASINGDLVFQAGGITERGRLNSAGDLGIGASADSRLRVLSAAGTASLRIGFANTSVNFFDADTQHFRSGSGSARMIMDGLAGIRPAIDGNENAGSASFRFNTIFAVTGTINTSDERAKTDIGPVPDAWLDAWGDVEWSRFKMTGGRRWHVGLVAQRVHAAFAARDLDAFDIGLCCFDAWDEQTQPVYEVVPRIEPVAVPSGEVYKSGKRKGEPKMHLVDREVEETVDTGRTEILLKAGDRWGLRYDECQAIEAAWQRREISKLKGQIALLIAGSSQAG